MIQKSSNDSVEAKLQQEWLKEAEPDAITKVAGENLSIPCDLYQEN